MKQNILIFHISQSNYWAILAWLIRLGAYLFTDNIWKKCFSHSALGYYGHDGQLYVIEMKGTGARLKPFNKIYNSKNFKGIIKSSITDIKLNPDIFQRILEINSNKTYSIGGAIKSQFGDYLHSKDNNESFCSYLVIDNLENIRNKDIFSGKNEKFSPTELYNYSVNILKYKTENVELSD